MRVRSYRYRTTRRPTCHRDSEHDNYDITRIVRRGRQQAVNYAHAGNARRRCANVMSLQYMTCYTLRNRRRWSNRVRIVVRRYEIQLRADENHVR